MYLVGAADGKAEEAIAAYKEALNACGDGLSGERLALAEKHLRGYVTENAEKIRAGILGGTLDIDSELKGDREFVERMKAGGIAELEAAAARQPEIVAPYDEEHMKYIKKAED